MALYRFTDDRVPALRSPILVTALDGWVDAAGAATGAAAHVAAGGEVVASFDTDALIDYRARRPLLDIVDGDLKSLDWPDLSVRQVRVEGHDLLVLTGPEPDYRWRAFADAVLDLIRRTGAIRSVTLGSLALAVPHTRPTPLVATASDRTLLRPDDQTPEGFLRVPAACSSAVEMILREHGVPTVGFFAQTPHYVGATYTPGVIALVERLGAHVGAAFPLGDLPDEAAAQRRQLDAIVEQRPDVKEYIARLEELQPGERMPTGDELAAEIERYLRESPGDTG